MAQAPADEMAQATPDVAQAPAADDFPECRICRDVASVGAALITPCGCRGSVAFVHSSCLLRWLKFSHGAALHGRPFCTVCQQPFRFRAPGLLSYILTRPAWVRPRATARLLCASGARGCTHLLNEPDCGHLECLAMRYVVALAALQLSLWEGQMALIALFGLARDALSLDRALDDLLVPPQLQPLLRAIIPSPLAVSDFTIGFPGAEAHGASFGTRRAVGMAAATAAATAMRPAPPARDARSHRTAPAGLSWWAEMLLPAGSTEAAAHMQAVLFGDGRVPSGPGQGRRAGGDTGRGDCEGAGRRGLLRVVCGSQRLAVQWASAATSSARAILTLPLRPFGLSNRVKPSGGIQGGERAREGTKKDLDLLSALRSDLRGAARALWRGVHSLFFEPFLIATVVRQAESAPCASPTRTLTSTLTPPGPNSNPCQINKPTLLACVAL